MRGESELEMVSRHISQGDVTLSRQRALVQRLRDAGHDANQAEHLLAEFEMLQAEHVAHLARITVRPS